MRYIDLTGQVFGDWTVVKRSDTKPRGQGSQAFWDCRCSCGDVKTVSSQSLRSGVSRGCRKCYTPISIVVGASVNKLYSEYKSGAFEKGRLFELSPELFRELIKMNCSYCGIEPLQKTTVKRTHGDAVFLYNGIDRVNSSLGYLPSNCVPCCKVCNIAKRAMTKEDFLLWLKRAYEYNYGKHNFAVVCGG